MKKYISWFSILIGFTGSVSAQDILYLLKGEESVSKIATQNIENITFKKSGSPQNSIFLYTKDGSMITISMAEIDSICFNLSPEELSGHTVLEIPTTLEVQYESGSKTASFTWNGTEETYELMIGSKTYPVQQTPYVVTDLKLGDYSWKVRSVKNGKYSIWVEGLSFKTIIDPPYNLHVASIPESERAVFSWKGGSANFEMELRKRFLSSNTMETYYPLENTLTLDTLKKGEYTWRLRIKLRDGYSDWMSGNFFVKSDHTTVLDIDQNLYAIITVGEQQWLQDNLRVTRLNDGTPIEHIPIAWEWKDAKNPAYCWYDNDASNARYYGALYNWYVVKTEKICPVGWHIPIKTEWDEFFEFINKNEVDICENIVKPDLKKSSTYEDAWCTLAGNREEFSGQVKYNKIKEVGYWWGWKPELLGYFRAYDTIPPIVGEIPDSHGSPNSGYSARCIRDTTP